eukprot:2618345-Prymnesium_polylepis.1
MCQPTAAAVGCPTLIPDSSNFVAPHRSAQCTARPCAIPPTHTAQPRYVSDTVACSETMPPGPTTERLTV